VDPKAFRAMISSIYTDACEMDENIVLGALYCAAKYQCTALLRNVNIFVKDQCSVGNACIVLQQLPTVFAGQTAELGFVEDNCHEVIETRGWSELSRDKMELILRSDRLMISEIELFRAVLKWAKGKVLADEKKLRVFMEPLLPLLRFPTLTLEQLATHVSPTQLLTTQQELVCFQYAAAQVNWGEADDIRPPPEEEKLKCFDESQFRERQSRGWVIRYDEGRGDTFQEGVFYWLGTRRKTAPWVNPSDIRDEKDQAMTICTVSSTASGVASTVTARAHENGYTRNSLPQWIQVELKSISVSPTHYQWGNRQPAHGSAMVPRNWRFEGSNDGTTWEVLSTHTNDASMPDTAGLVRGWKLEGVKSRFFKFFRFNMTGPNAYGNGQLNFGNLEIFGTIRM